VPHKRPRRLGGPGEFAAKATRPRREPWTGKSSPVHGIFLSGENTHEATHNPYTTRNSSACATTRECARPHCGAQYVTVRNTSTACARRHRSAQDLNGARKASSQCAGLTALWTTTASTSLANLASPKRFPTVKLACEVGEGGFSNQQLCANLAALRNPKLCQATALRRGASRNLSRKCGGPHKANNLMGRAATFNGPREKMRRVTARPRHVQWRTMRARGCVGLSDQAKAAGPVNPALTGWAGMWRGLRPW